MLLAVSTLLAARPRAVDSQISAKANSISTAGRGQPGERVGRRAESHRQATTDDEHQHGQGLQQRADHVADQHGTRGRWPWCGTGR